MNGFKYTCKCGVGFNEEAHNIVVDLGENTKAHVNFNLHQENGEFWCFCKDCLQTMFQQYFNELNPTQKNFMRDMLTKSATSILKTTGSDISIGATPADIQIIDEVEPE
jgi:hypothetical protein